MTPAARIAAAIDCLNPILKGEPAERVLTTWARQNRFAGSSDRAAIRDLVYDALRRKRSYGWLGGNETGRALMIGALRAQGADLEEVFSGARFAPDPLTRSESAPSAPLDRAPLAVQLDCPDWLWPRMERSLGDGTADVLRSLRNRAPVTLRVNRARTDVETAQAVLTEEGIETRTLALSPTALEVIKNPRRVQQSRAYRDGLVELQDAASQAVVDCLLPLLAGKSVLDYCAGGGGKALAMAAGGAGLVTAHDADPRRMSDIPARAARAGTRIDIAEQPEGTFDLVLCDAPCSGTGAWRRQPDAKWRLTEERLRALTAVQDNILDVSQEFVAKNGVLAYATCSLLDDENEARIQAFLATNEMWHMMDARRFSPLDGGDGFFLAVLQRRA